MDFEPRPWRKTGARKRAHISEFPRRIRANTMGRTSCVPPFGILRTILFVYGVSLWHCSNLLYQKFVRISTKSHIRALKLLCAKHRAFPKEKNVMCEYKCGLGFTKTFFWGKGFAKPRLFFWNSAGFGFSRAGGVWGGMRAGFGFLFFGEGGR